MSVRASEEVSVFSLASGRIESRACDLFQRMHCNSATASPDLMITGFSTYPGSLGRRSLRPVKNMGSFVMGVCKIAYDKKRCF